MKKTIKYFIEGKPEPAAGFLGFSEEIEVSVDSGDPGGEDGEFQTFIKECLNEWYDDVGGKVVGIQE